MRRFYQAVCGGVLAAFLAGLAAKRLLLSDRFFSYQGTRSVAALPLVRVGRPLIKGDSPGDKRSLILVLRPDCIHCARSATFHRTLIEAAMLRGLQVLIVVPSTDWRSRWLLHKNFPHRAPVKTYESLLRRPVGVPAIVMADGRGIVSAFWYGELSREEEREVIRALDDPFLAARRKRQLASGETMMDTEEVQRLLKVRPDAALVRLEERAQADADPWPGAVVIPASELEMRAWFELRGRSSVVLDCAPLDDASCELAVEKLRARGIPAIPADLSR